MTASRQHIARPAAFTLMEVTVAMALLASALVIIAQLVVMVTKQQRQAHFRRIATQEAANVLERALVLPPAELSDQHVDQLQLSQNVQQLLPQPELDVRVDAENIDQTVQGRRITVRLSWQTASREQAEPVELTSWAYWPTAAEVDQ